MKIPFDIRIIIFYHNPSFIHTPYNLLKIWEAFLGNYVNFILLDFLAICWRFCFVRLSSDGLLPPCSSTAIQVFWYLSHMSHQYLFLWVKLHFYPTFFSPFSYLLLFVDWAQSFRGIFFHLFFDIELKINWWENI